MKSARLVPEYLMQSVIGGQPCGFVCVRRRGGGLVVLGPTEVVVVDWLLMFDPLLVFEALRAAMVASVVGTTEVVVLPVLRAGAPARVVGTTEVVVLPVLPVLR
jgi:hypothetical protein